jgi:hypothetical protein
MFRWPSWPTGSSKGPYGEPRLSADRHADGFAPLADGRIADAVNGAVGPFGRRGRERGGVGVIRRRVVREKEFAFAIAAIDNELDHVEKRGVSAPAPADVDLGAANRGADVGLDGSEIRAGLLRTFDAERGVWTCDEIRVRDQRTGGF